jgi:SAM-dependent methyltransferase
LTFRAINTPGNGVLKHSSGNCTERYPVIDGIPRLLVGDARGQLVRAHRDWFAAHRNSAEFAEDWNRGGDDDPVIAGFDDEWSRFREVGTGDHEDVYAMYFDLLPLTHLAKDKTVLDAGCGAGRWAFEVSRRGPRVIAVDLGRSVEVARANTDPERVACVQADLESLPIAPGAVDWAYSLGVIHHTQAPKRALASIVKAVRAGGLVVLYLYYALEQRGPFYRGLFGLSNALRSVLSQQPRFVVRTAATLIAFVVYWPLARCAALLKRSGAVRLARGLPLSFYASLSFRTMLNDSLDRFGTRLERRYTRAELTALMQDAGLVDVALSESPPFWHGVGTKPGSRGSER